MEQKATVEEVLQATYDLLGNIWLPAHMKEQIDQIDGARGNIMACLNAFARNAPQQNAPEPEPEEEIEAEVEVIEPATEG